MLGSSVYPAHGRPPYSSGAALAHTALSCRGKRPPFHCRYVAKAEHRCLRCWDAVGVLIDEELVIGA